MDTGGQETFNSQNKLYYKKADCVLLVYDITSLKSFNACKNYYIKQILNICKEDIKVILLGNKTDLEQKREVTQEMGSNLAKQYNFYFKETSCEENYNVSDSFETLIEMTNTDMLKKGTLNLKEEDLRKQIEKKKCC